MTNQLHYLGVIFLRVYVHSNEVCSVLFPFSYHTFYGHLPLNLDWTPGLAWGRIACLRWVTKVGPSLDVISLGMLTQDECNAWKVLIPLQPSSNFDCPSCTWLQRQYRRSKPCYRHSKNHARVCRQRVASALPALFRLWPSVIRAAGQDGNSLLRAGSLTKWVWIWRPQFLWW